MWTRLESIRKYQNRN
jgi:glutamate dehydrogenase (NAD(P)+)